MKSYFLFLVDVFSFKRVGKWWITFLLFAFLNLGMELVWGMRIELFSLYAIGSYLIAWLVMHHLVYFIPKLKQH
ncbi:MAG: hypothetical protein ACD_22C00011G0002 [uncultured bacterium]|uniref:Uncharacterized protein n=2 Tax=Candidatus Woykeibacteriota TaxID=1817899 RepID=A0A1G1WW57_9BACT|nr:MAG: hypothetical protein ACD_22C00011G0002 [uncultured bacterium]OGY27961.1 MAG: hypothetical protein A2802_00980 [Candidatus Woykebacteria bacterium RIFCSPHIGHO2_01_FULL_43_29]OGY29210.1 MAG: hypothetical protein A3F33_01150 [Candidatus Woykebacteria bacterium RIFCSPHIGHO2_12_FULL_43_10]OGY30024.1 MAG: hypothetical protein A3J50_03000 [Candidatus Woykebacteria bacterium RIFCSPHIGHO2_02_FULL_43_16b]OGY31988.1 MAG: hypothetical protein A3A61_01035 [Candidatus Woykebacteria bacterium RIFCSPLO